MSSAQHNLSAIPAFDDNYIWCIQHANRALIVDPGDAEAVINYLEQHELELDSILITHHHADHIGGVKELWQQFGEVDTFAPAHDERCLGNIRVSEGDTINPLGLNFSVLNIPGHTLGHIAFYNKDWLFCGDTLFAAGCGRVFEGTFEQMYQSLQKLAALADDTLVCCAHEYTVANLKFATHVLPDRADLQQRLAECQALHAENRATLPSNIGLEKTTNLFLQCDQADVQAACSKQAGEALSDPVSVFATLRQWKDSF